MAQQKQAAGRKTAKTATVVKAGKGIAAKAVKPPAPRGQKSDAALYYISAGYTTVGKELYGIQAASEGVMRAIARYAGLPRFPAVTHSNEESAVFADTIKKLNPALETVRIHPMATAP